MNVKHNTDAPTHVRACNIGRVKQKIDNTTTTDRFVVKGWT